MIDYINGLIVLAYRRRLIYFSADDLMTCDDEDGETTKEIGDGQYKSIDMNDDKKIVCMQEIG